MAGVADLRFDGRFERFIRDVHRAGTEANQAARRAIRSIAVWERGKMRKAFDNSAQLGGRAWPQNTQRWRDKKLSQGKSPKPGIYKGELQESLGEDISEMRLRASVGSNADTAGWLVRRRGWEREFRPTQQKSLDRFATIVDDEMGRMLKRRLSP